MHTLELSKLMPDMTTSHTDRLNEGRVEKDTIHHW